MPAVCTSLEATLREASYPCVAAFTDSRSVLSEFFGLALSQYGPRLAGELALSLGYAFALGILFGFIGLVLNAWKERG